MSTRLALVGVGKIARDQHLPSLSRSAAFELAAAVSRNATVEGVESYTDLDAFLAARPDVDALSFCTPPAARFDGARAALAAGRHVMLEKPPGATLGEVAALDALARSKGVALFASWHSRAAPAVAPAKAWLAETGATLRSGRIVWKEDVRRWHPGQAWICEPGGYGVFDPGINALSILTEISPREIVLTAATLQTPENRQTPIAARLSLRTEDGAPIEVELDWRHQGDQTWDIEIETDRGALTLTAGGASMALDGASAAAPADLETEYDGLYARFSELIAARAIDADIRPMRLVADAYLIGRRETVAPFHDDEGNA